MHINGTGPVNNLSSIKPSSRPNGVDKTHQAASVQPSDELMLSGEAKALSSSEVRMDRVNQIKQQIASGTYETPEKLEAALDRMLDQIG